MRIFCSTGGFKDKSFVYTADSFLENNIDHIEFSSGLFEESAEQKLMEISKRAQIQLHNYFPTPRREFVLNLASSNQRIYEESLNFFKEGIRLSAKVNSSFYGIHAGFLVDPKPNELGKTIKTTEKFERRDALAKFALGLSELCQESTRLGVRLLVENNVISQSNYIEHSQNIVLLAQPTEILEFFNVANLDIGLLLDVGHLKVSSNTLNFDLHEAMNSLNSIAVGYHLSDNNGLWDGHQKYDESAWFFSYLDDSKHFSTIELNSLTVQEMRDVYLLTRNKLGGT